MHLFFSLLRNASSNMKRNGSAVSNEWTRAVEPRSLTGMNRNSSRAPNFLSNWHWELLISWDRIGWDYLEMQVVEEKSYKRMIIILETLSSHNCTTPLILSPFKNLSTDSQINFFFAVSTLHPKSLVQQFGNYTLDHLNYVYKR